MKLAVALQLRTTITEAIARQPHPNPVMAHRAGTVNRAAPTPVGQAKPLVESVNKRINPLTELQPILDALPAKKEVLTFDVETQQMYRQLEALDAKIQEANHTTKHTLPSSIPLEPGDAKGVKKTLAAFLLRRKTLKERASRLEQYLAAVPQKPQINRIKVSDEVDDLTIVYPVLDMEEVRRTYNQTQMSLRAIDNLIQQANWQVDVDVPAWVRQGFLTDDIDPPAAKAAKTKTEVVEETTESSSKSPVAPMLSVPSGATPALRPAALAAPALAPAAATPAEGTGLFIPPPLEVDDGDPSSDDGWTQE